MTANSAPPQLSPDGYWWWTGTAWVPADQRPLDVQPEPETAHHAPEPEPAPEPVLQFEAAPRPEPAPYIPAMQITTTPFQILPAAAEPTSRRGPLRTLIAAGAAAVVLVGAGAAYGVGQYLSGGGQQPEAVLPADAVGVMKVDLDPSFDQKRALFELSRRFPRLHASSADSIRDDLLRAMLSSSQMNYEKDVKPWLGDRAAIAAVPDSGPSGFAPVAAVQFTDRDKATKTLRLASIRSSVDHPFAFAFSGDYAVIANTQAAADRYAHASTHLADNASYQRAVAALGGDQIAVAWADMGAVYRALPAKLLKGNPLFAQLKAGSKAPKGEYVVGAHATGSYLEIQGKAVGTPFSRTAGTAVGAVRSSNLIATLPADVDAAMEVTGLGPAMTQAYRSFLGAGDPLGIAAKAKGFGLSLPGDLSAVLGEDTAVGMLGDLQSGAPTVVAHVRTKQPARAVAVLNRVAGVPGAPPVVVRRDATGYVLATDSASLAAVSSGHLGRSPSFVRALPDAKGAAMALYVSFRQLPLPPSAGLGGLDALGMTVDPTTGAFRLRLTVS